MLKKPKNPWKKLSSKYVYKNAFIKVREDKVIDPQGKKALYGVIERTPVVYIIAVNDDGKICLVGQYRYTTGVYSWEIPAGGCDGDSPLAAAKRELWEETGFKAKQWKKLGMFQTAMGIANIECHVYLAKQLTQTGKNKMHEEGIAEIRMVSLTQIAKEFISGKNIDGPTAAALFYYLSSSDKKK